MISDDVRQRMVFRRAIALDRRAAGVVVGWVEDDFHHFGVTIEHRAGHVSAVRTKAVRYPWTTCPGAGDPLTRIVGLPLLRRPSELGAMLPMALQCTHMFELAALAMTHAQREQTARRYDAIIAVPRDQPPGRATAHTASLLQDERPVLKWQVEGRTIVAPPEAAGQSLSQGFRQWIDQLGDEAAEHAWTLRRAAWLAQGNRDFYKLSVASETGMEPVCHTFQPEQRNRAFAMPASVRDYEPSSAPLLSHRHETP